jgi:hypothetical protein
MHVVQSCAIDFIVISDHAPVYIDIGIR